MTDELIGKPTEGVPPEEEAKDPEMSPKAPAGGKVPATGEGPTRDDPAVDE